MAEDAQNEVLKEIFTEALTELNIDNASVIGEPAVTKFDKKDDGSIEIELKIASKPTVKLGDYKALLPEVETKEVTDGEVDDKINKMASENASLGKIARKRKVKTGDFVLIDFEGFKDDVAFDGGKAEKHSLELGSNSFIPGFEDQIIDMAYDEEKEIKKGNLAVAILTAIVMLATAMLIKEVITSILFLVNAQTLLSFLGSIF